MAPGHDFHLQLPGHRGGFGLSLGSCRNKQARLRRARWGAGGEGRGRAGSGARGRGARVTDSRGRAQARSGRRGDALTVEGRRGSSLAGAETSFRKGSQRRGRGGFRYPGPTVIEREATPSQHAAEPRLQLHVSLLPPPKRWRHSDVEEASIIRRSAARREGI